MIRSEFIKVVGDSVAVNVPDDIATSVAESVETRLRSIIKDAMMVMQMTNRRTLSVDDVNQAMKQQNMDPLLGYSSSDPISMKYVRSTDIDGMFYPEDVLVQTSRASQDIPAPYKVPTEPVLSLHWLAITGVQPNIPQNPTLLEQKQNSLAFTEAAITHAYRQSQAIFEVVGPSSSKRKLQNIIAKTGGKMIDAGAGSGPFSKIQGDYVLLKSEALHALTLEHQKYLSYVTYTIVNGSVAAKLKVYKVMSNDISIGPLVPFLCQFIITTIAANLPNLSLISSLIALTSSLLASSHINLDPYLHQLLPSVLTVLVCARLGTSASDDHHSIRVNTASVLRTICLRFGAVYPTLQPRITRILSRAVVDLTKSPASLYGSLSGLLRIGYHTIKSCIIPHVHVLLSHIQELTTFPNRPVTYKSKVIVHDIKNEDNSDDFMSNNDVQALGHHQTSKSPSIPTELPWDLTCAAGKQSIYEYTQVLRMLYRCIGVFVHNELTDVFHAELLREKRDKTQKIALIRQQQQQQQQQQQHQQQQQQQQELTIDLTSLRSLISKQRQYSEKARVLPRVHSVDISTFPSTSPISTTPTVPSSRTGNCYAANTNSTAYAHTGDLETISMLNEYLNEVIYPYIVQPCHPLTDILL